MTRPTGWQTAHEVLKSLTPHLIWTKYRLEPPGVDLEIAATASQERRQILSPTAAEDNITDKL